MTPVLSLPARDTTTQPRQASPVSARQALALVVCISVAMRLLWVAVEPPNMDEGYHYLYAAHPDWSYFDHPPMMMLVIRAGLELCGGEATFFSLRLGFVLLGAGSSLLLAAFTSRWFGAWAGVYAALLWNLTPFFGLVAGGQAMPDGPFLFFALLTMIALAHALINVPGKTLPWVWVGLAWAGALLSKYHAVFLPAGAVLYMLLTPQGRRQFLAPGPYLAVVLGVIGFAPVIYWNATHYWASFAFQAGRAVGTEFRPHEVVFMVLGQMGHLTPWLWATMVLMLVGMVRGWRRLTQIEQLLTCLAVVPLAFFLAVSCVRQVCPHWPLIGFVPLMPLAGRLHVEWSERWPRAIRRALLAWSAALVSVAFLYAAHCHQPLIALDNDPALDQRGWPELAAELDARGLIGEPDTFAFTTCWHDSGQLGFALGNRMPVLCCNPTDARGFPYWSKAEDWVGKNGILITFDDNFHELAYLAPFFRRTELVAEFPMTPVRQVRVYRCIEQLQPCPYRR
jgi:Dolichyl-phosphate-mannose-protein mannosyltransferase